MNVIAIPYGPKWTTALAGFIVACAFGAGSASLLFDKRALENSTFARLLGPTVSMVGIAIGLLAFVLAAVAALYVLYISLSRSRLIVLYDDHFSFPHGLLFSSVATIPYKAITALSIEALGTKPESALRIRCTNSTLLVVEPMLPSPQHLQLLHRELATRAHG
jgi:hypothetical protein